MNASQRGFPRVAGLQQGVILGTIVHAISIAADPEFAYELWWDGPNYNRQDGQGTRGTITFANARIVGAFCDDSSPRAPWRSGIEYRLDAFFAGMPEDLRLIAHQQTLRYLLNGWEGVDGPIVTAAFWSRGDYLTAAGPWQEVFTHGAHLVRIEVMEIEDAISAWQEEYELSDIQINLLRSLFGRKMSASDTPVLVEDWEYNILVVGGTKGLDKSRELLAAIGLFVPDK